MSQDREHLSGFASMRHPQTAPELMQVLQAANWWWTSLPRPADVIEPLPGRLEEHMGRIQRRNKRVASNRVIVKGVWTLKQVAA